MSEGTRNPGRVLVVGLQGLGNLVLATPALRLLSASGNKPDVLVPGPVFSELLAHRSDVGSVIQIEGRSLWNLVVELRQRRYDTVILTHPSGPRSTLLARAIGADRIAGMVIRRSPWASRLLTDRLEPTAGMHDVEANLRLARLVLGERPDTGPDPLVFPDLPLTALEKKEARDWLGGIRTDSNSKWQSTSWLGLVPGSGRNQPFKRWSASRFRNLADYLRSRYSYLGILIFIGPDELDLASHFESPDAVGPTTLIKGLPLRKTLALLAECETCLANDNGMMHMAAALGVRTIGIFGPTDPLRNGPVGKETRVLTEGLDCSPCYSFDRKRFHCTHHDHMACLKGIELNTVTSVLGLEPDQNDVNDHG